MTISARKRGRGRPTKFPPSRALQVRIDPQVYAVLVKYAAETKRSKAAIVAGLIQGLNGKLADRPQK